MHLLCFGVDHTTASIALRERLVCSLPDLQTLLRKASDRLQESVVLSTCHRFEWYATCEEAETGLALIRTLLGEVYEIPPLDLAAHARAHIDQQVVRHLFEVACGLHSLVPGEPQIQGQVAKALEAAQAGGSAGPLTSALFRAALVAGKRARSETDICRHTSSLSHVAVRLARSFFPQLEETRILLLGAGHMGALAAQNLWAHGAHHLTILNRTPLQASALTSRVGAIFRPLTDVPVALQEADVVIAATAAPHALITPQMVQAVRDQDRSPGRVLLFIDLALPRNIDPGVAQLSGVHLIDLDDLQVAADEGIQRRLQEVAQVEVIVASEADTFVRWLASLQVVGTINGLRGQAQALREQELARTLKQLVPGLSERETSAIQELTTRLMNKWLHVPTLRLKEAAAAGQGTCYAEVVRYVFGLRADLPESNASQNMDPLRQVEAEWWSWDPMRVHP